MQRKAGRMFGSKKGTSKEKKNRAGAECLHRKNFRTVALPIILLFYLIRIVAFQLWLLLANAYDVAHALRDRKSKGKQRMTESLGEPLVTMANNARCNKRTNSAGPGEPALAMQKHHHRKAFEHISKALKIDEEGGE